MRRVSCHAIAAIGLVGISGLSQCLHGEATLHHKHMHRLCATSGQTRKLSERTTRNSSLTTRRATSLWLLARTPCCRQHIAGCVSSCSAKKHACNVGPTSTSQSLAESNSCHDLCVQGQTLCSGSLYPSLHCGTCWRRMCLKSIVRKQIKRFLVSVAC